MPESSKSSPITWRAGGLMFDLDMAFETLTFNEYLVGRKEFRRTLEKRESGWRNDKKQNKHCKDNAFKSLKFELVTAMSAIPRTHTHISILAEKWLAFETLFTCVARECESDYESDCERSSRFRLGLKRKVFRLRIFKVNGSFW